MIIEKLPILLAVLVALAASSRAEISTKYTGLDDFSDFTVSGRSGAKTKGMFERELARHDIQKLVGDRNLQLTFTDIDMAGDTQFENLRSARNVRVVHGPFPPRLSFSWILKDANGQTLASGKEKIKDVGFDLSGRFVKKDYENFFYELRLLKDWAKKKLPKA
ncbi:MAG: DUF3016 domain-containing protein [Verrucomicrobiota bacterium]